ncbi:MAG: HTH-type transcriptional regulator SinR [Pelotomaculum sp. PtaB.Bin104]|nr:MAG: HTH-type transcriptional regulator SinR [Pelotomaculum sp. PtaB.Bin104]
MDIGNRIASLRDKAELTGSALAAKVGLDQSQICKIEKGVCNPSITTLRKICAALDISLADFFSEDNPEKMPEHLNSLVEKARKLSPDEVIQLCKLLEVMSLKKE